MEEITNLRLFMVEMSPRHNQRLLTLLIICFDSVAVPIVLEL